LFIGNVGINVFKHVCLEDGVSVSYFVQNEHDCDSHAQKVDACCHTLTEKKKDCCTDSIEYVNVELDFFESEDELHFGFIPENPTKLALFEQVTLGFNQRCFTRLYDDPPPYSSKYLRIRHQLFII
jgi:hypothetical protein